MACRTLSVKGSRKLFLSVTLPVSLYACAQGIILIPQRLSQRMLEFLVKILTLKMPINIRA